MIFDSRLKNNQPESLILDILAKKPRLTSKEIFEYFSKKYPKKMTIQGFYKVIRKMLDDRILLKEGMHISLDSFWINKVIEFSKNIESTYLQQRSSSSNILLEEGENKDFEFNNVIEMDNLWSHSMNIVRNYYEKNEHSDKNAYSRNYFSVFHIARTESESANIQYFESSNMQWYMASGSDTFLNRLPSKLLDNGNYHQFIFDFEEYNAGKETQIEKNYWVTVIGDYIFEASLPKYIFELVEKIYAETQSIGEFNADKINYLFKEPGKALFSVSCDKKRAEEIRQDVHALYKKTENDPAEH
jgi:hypothetical protein